MPVLDDIEALQNRLDDLVDDIPLSQDDVVEAAVQAILRLLDERDLQSLSGGQIDALITEALRPAAQQLTGQTQQVVSERVQTLISETQAFYASVGVTVPDRLSDAVRKRETAQRVTESLKNGLQISSQKLKQETLDAVENELASEGSPSRDAIEDSIRTSVDDGANAAETHARTAITAYDQEYRDELASATGLDQFLYFGNLQSNSRRFCVATLGGIYTSEQIDQMRNGQIEPVRTFCGGYNCRHSWVPVDPTWDDDLDGRQVPDDTDPLTVGPDDRTVTYIPADPNQ